MAPDDVIFYIKIWCVRVAYSKHKNDTKIESLVAFCGQFKLCMLKHCLVFLPAVLQH